MPEVERIADLLARAYEGPAWHGPDVSRLLEGLLRRALGQPATTEKS